MSEIRHFDIGSPLHIFNSLAAEIIRRTPNQKELFYLDIFLPNLKEFRLSWEAMTLLANLLNFQEFPRTDCTLNEDVEFHKLKYLRIVEIHMQGGDSPARYIIIHAYHVFPTSL
ncbi:hypothetical protein H5410_030036 [Solanum commersonii]|uniref:Uncharacterized protein n=1 Tax=Solanum commersonii TaxID=4109 RepID=A0A9J5YEL6_SOLCO|nr:hypothetical protein H5410_030036 [Solanum commersonii]